MFVSIATLLPAQLLFDLGESPRLSGPGALALSGRGTRVGPAGLPTAGGGVGLVAVVVHVVTKARTGHASFRPG